MQVLADTWPFRNHAEDVVAEVPGVTGEESEPLNGGNLIMDPGQKIGKGGCCLPLGNGGGFRPFPERAKPRADLGHFNPTNGEGKPMGVSIVVHGLAEQSDLDDSGIGQTFAFVNDVLGWSVDFRTTSMGDHAVGAELVATSSYSDVCGAVAATGRIGIEGSSKV